MSWFWFWRTEREKWASPKALSNLQPYLGLPGLDARSRDLYERALPRSVLVPRFGADRPPVNSWMPPNELAEYSFKAGQIILGKIRRTVSRPSG
jgi:type IV secretion system protein VirD4